MKKIKLENNWYSEDEPELYLKEEIDLIPGLTVLVGCNGCGKTTTLYQIREQLKDANIPYFDWDNLTDGGSAARQIALHSGNMRQLAMLAQASEGENIIQNIGTLAASLKHFIQTGTKPSRYYKPEPSTSIERFVLLDAIDSGLSIDNIMDIKRLFSTMIEDANSQGLILYIIVSANSFEMARNEHCLDIRNGKYYYFSDYENYRHFILESREEKEKRYTEDLERG